ncbi:MAG: histidine kinase [Lachnospiraceae bacterium]|nr:histidine kinase [Lachnospiraceae bacterium]
MKNKLQKYFKSRIVKKMVQRILMVEAISLMLTLFMSYAILWPKLTRSAVEDAVSINLEIANQIDTTITNMVDSSKFLITANDLRNTLSQYYDSPDSQNYNRVCLAINNLITSMSFVRGVVLEAEEGTRFNSITNLRSEDLAILDSDIYRQVQKSSYLKRFSSIYPVAAKTPMQGMAYIANYSIGAKSYTLTVFYNANFLVSSIRNLSDSQFDGCILADFLGNAFYQTGSRQWPDFEPEGLLSQARAYEKTSGGYYFYSTVSATQWRFISYMDTQTLNATFMEHFFISLLLCLFTGFITVLFIVPVAFRIVSPIRELNETMQSVSTGNLSCYSQIQSDDEIGDLSRVYNQMIDSLNRHIQSLLEYEAKEARMKYNLLIAQIDSHFIYNTMSIINSFARRGATQEIIAINSALIKILQNCLRVRTIDVTDTIAQEIEIVNQYWIIENMRYDNQAQLIWQVSEELLEELIPKNLIQPIVENCLFHGLTNEDTGIISGIITITFTKSQHAITLTIADNGIGIPPSVLDFLNQPDEFTEQFNQRGKHIGLSNIRKRLDYIYHGKASMVIENRGGAIVTMVLPLEG